MENKKIELTSKDLELWLENTEEMIDKRRFQTTLEWFLGKRFMKKNGYFNLDIRCYTEEKKEMVGIKFYGLGDNKAHEKIRKMLIKHASVFYQLLDSYLSYTRDADSKLLPWEMKDIKIYGRMLL